MPNPAPPDAPGRSPHLLYVAWSYPPARSAGIYRAIATTNAFARAGWRVTVIAASRDTFERLTGTDTESEALIDRRITVHRVPFDPALGESDLSRWSRPGVYSPILWNFVHGLLSRRAFPENVYGRWAPVITEKADQVHREDPVDLVIGSAVPDVDFAPGNRLHRTSRVPYVMDYRDAWHLDVYSGRTLGKSNGRSRRLEKKLIDHATEVWFVNQPIRDWHAEMYPAAASRFHVVANGYDPEVLNPTAPHVAAAGGLTFGYLGTIYGPIPLAETLEGWRRARESSAVIAKSRLIFRGRIGHVAQPDPAVVELFEKYREHGVHYGGPVSKVHVADVYNEFDALLLILSRSRFVTSGKVFEYAATGLPIAALHHPDTAATHVLQDYPRRVSVSSPTPEAIAQAIVDAGKLAVEGTAADRERAREWSAGLSREAQLAPRVAALQERLLTRASKGA